MAFFALLAVVLASDVASPFAGSPSGAEIKAARPPTKAAEERKADPRPADRDGQRAGGLVDRLASGVVCISTLDAEGGDSGFGSGFLLEGSGWVATSFHVIQNAAKAYAQFRDGSRLPVLGYRAVDPDSDLAILELDGSPAKAVRLRLAPQEGPKQGAGVIAIGHPKGFKHTVSRGTVNAIRKTSELPAVVRELVDAPDHIQWIQTDAVIAEGSSGGPLLDEQGRVVGVSTWTVDGRNLGFGVHVRHLRALLETARKAKKAMPLPPQTRDERNPLAPMDPKIAELLTEYQRASEEFVAQAVRAYRERQTSIKAENPTPKYRKRFMKLAADHPKTRLAYQALVITCDMCGDRTKAAAASLKEATDRLLADHLREKSLGAVALAQMSSPHEAGTAFLRQLIKRSPHQRTKAIACFCLAVNLSRLPGEDKKREEEIIGLLQRVVDGFEDVKVGNASLHQAARPLLFERKHLSVGRTPPDVAGSNLEGKPIKLSDFRGKVVVLDFFADWCPACSGMYPHERLLVKALEKRPFALIGISGDPKARLKQLAEEKKVIWPVLWDERGEINRRWNIRAVPNIFVLDPKGVIRYRFVGNPGPQLDDAVRTLLKEATGEDIEELSGNASTFQRILKALGKAGADRKAEGRGEPRKDQKPK